MSERAMVVAPADDVSVTESQWKVMKEQAVVFIKSGMLPSHIKTPEAAITVMIKGRELGVPPMYALSNIVVINGKPTANSELMLALVQRDHGNEAIEVEETTNERCVVSYAPRGATKRRMFTFTIADAKQAGLLGNQTWSKYPAAMLRARAISAVARMAFASSIGGMYLPEELGADVTVDDHGEQQVIHAAPVITMERPAPAANPNADVITGEIVEDAAPPRVTDEKPAAKQAKPEGKPGGITPAQRTMLTNLLQQSGGSMDLDNMTSEEASKAITSLKRAMNTGAPKAPTPSGTDELLAGEMGRFAEIAAAKGMTQEQIDWCLEQACDAPTIQEQFAEVSKWIADVEAGRVTGRAVDGMRTAQASWPEDRAGELA